MIFYTKIINFSYRDRKEQDNNSSDASQSDNIKVTFYDKITLKNINLEIKKGEFVVIIGEIGSGKSSLISSIIGDMLHVDTDTLEIFCKDYISTSQHNPSPNNENLCLQDHIMIKTINKAIKESKFEPDIKIKGTVSLIEQSPWILNQTIRDNILFGQSLIPEKYNETIEICQLARDLEILPGGDLTQIGENGINLSGGQKARVSIARAVYANNDIVLMDDPLSALDAHVKKQIFDKVICDKLKGKTRVLVTHAIDILDKADRIIVLDQGQIIHQGHYDKLKDLEYFRNLFDNLHHEEKGSEEKEDLDNDKIDYELSPKETINKSANKDYIGKNEVKLTIDENKEEISTNSSLYYNFLTYSNWTPATILISIFLITADKILVMLFSYYMLKWIKDISVNSSNDSSLLSKVIYATIIMTLITFAS